MNRTPMLLAALLLAASLADATADTPPAEAPPESCQSCNARHAALKKLQQMKKDTPPVLLPLTEEAAATDETEE